MPMPALECRRCGKIMQYQQVKDLPFFPFCSERCKMIDLGKWLDEEHRLPGSRPEETPKEDQRPGDRHGDATRGSRSEDE
jgi:uncharacterized protein